MCGRQYEMQRLYCRKKEGNGRGVFYENPRSTKMILIIDYQQTLRNLLNVDFVLFVVKALLING